MKKIVVITGPTGIGKTKISIALAKALKGEIINADSMQVYQELNIGTAKIKKEEQENIPHHLFDICSIKESYNVFSYQKDARNILDVLLKQDITPFVVGGTGLYIKALLYDYSFKKEENNLSFSEYTNEELLNRIKEYNPDTSIHINNRVRLERTLNKYLNGGKDIVSKPLYDFIVIGLTTNRELLYKRINSRVDLMFKEGLLAEAKFLYEHFPNSRALETAIGYKELFKYFRNELTLDNAIDLIKKSSRHYAKRQYTFFNNQLNVNWVNIDYQNITNTVKEIINIINEK